MNAHTSPKTVKHFAGVRHSMKYAQHDRGFGLLYLSLMVAHLVAGGYVLWLGYHSTLDWPKAGIILGGLAVSMIFSLCRLMMNYNCKSCDHILLPPKGWAKCTLTGSTIFHCWRCNTDWHTGLLAPAKHEVHTLHEIPLKGIMQQPPPNHSHD